jgi:hypothetical protein
MRSMARGMSRSRLAPDASGRPLNRTRGRCAHHAAWRAQGSARGDGRSRPRDRWVLRSSLACRPIHLGSGWVAARLTAGGTRGYLPGLSGARCENPRLVDNSARVVQRVVARQLRVGVQDLGAGPGAAARGTPPFHCVLRLGLRGGVGETLAARKEAYWRLRLYEVQDAEGKSATDRFKERYGTAAQLPEGGLPAELRVWPWHQARVRASRWACGRC